MTLFEEIYHKASLDDTINLCDSLLADLSPLKERIVIDGVNAKIEIDNNLVSIFKDIKGTVLMTKKLLNAVSQSRRGVITHAYEKYFRLVSDNMKKLVAFCNKVFNDSRIMEKLPTKILEKGKATVESFIKSMNGVFKNLNSQLHIDEFTELSPPRWRKPEEPMLPEWKIERDKLSKAGYNMRTWQ